MLFNDGTYAVVGGVTFTSFRRIRWHDLHSFGQAASVLRAPVEFVSQISSALTQVGFEVVDAAGISGPGLRVTAVPEGALVCWASSGRFTSPAHGQARHVGSDGSVRVLVQATMAEVLAQLGYTVLEASAGGDLVVLADSHLGPVENGPMRMLSADADQTSSGSGRVP
ncbi:hypothetical protein [Streptomyces hundungensis]|uniref:hypothetical protein n=1 Tax=Streptomyces hundungensis TaxID=1077946 RepID=UPI00340DD3AA